MYTDVAHLYAAPFIHPAGRPRISSHGSAVYLARRQMQNKKTSPGGRAVIRCPIVFRCRAPPQNRCSQQSVFNFFEKRNCAERRYGGTVVEVRRGQTCPRWWSRRQPGQPLKHAFRMRSATMETRFERSAVPCGSSTVRHGTYQGRHRYTGCYRCKGQV